MSPGLVSITFRQLTPQQILKLAADAGLECMEWGGDIHVRHGNLNRAKEVNQITREHGLRVSGYGSYYRLAESEAEGLAFETVVDTALALGAPLIRVWAGSRSSNIANADYRSCVAHESLRCAAIAEAAGLAIAFEYHDGTLMDTDCSVTELLEATSTSAVFTHWQPPHGRTEGECIASLQNVLHRLANVHVFHWWPDPTHRLSISAGAERWKKYFSLLQAAGKTPDLLLEFLPADDPAALIQEAATLKGWIAATGM